MSVVLVASDRPGAGKTAAALALKSILNQAGKTAVAFKPFASGADDVDGHTFAGLANPAPEGWPLLNGEPDLSAEDIRGIGPDLDAATANSDVAILELPHYAGPEAAAAAAQALDATVILVAAYRRDLRGPDLRAWQESLGESLLGVLVNGVTRYLGTEASENLVPSLDEAGIACIGLVPEDRLMLSVTVEQVREALDGRYVVDEGDRDQPLEWYQVGAMSLDPGEIRFALYDNNAVVVRGDRPDIQMSALNGSASCLILTGGVDPIEYISYEAREEETPVIVVEPDTLSTMAALNEVTTGVRMDSAAKVERFASLLRSHADLEQLWSAL